MQYPTKMNRHTIKARLSRKGGRKNLTHSYLRHQFQKQPSQCRGAPSSQKKPSQRIISLIKQNAPTIVVCASILWCLAEPVFAVNVPELIIPVTDLKDTIFGGWMWVPKIGAAVGGCLMAVYNQSIMPLATGAGVGLGIHFYDLYIKAEGALI
jgi:hypothetical protein